MAIFISDPSLPPTPVYTDKGILKRQCAPSSSPVKILSLTFAQEDSFDTSTFTPYFSNKPSSLAITIGAQSVNGIIPRRITSFSLTSVYKGPADDSNSSKTGSANQVFIDFI